MSRRQLATLKQLLLDLDELRRRLAELIPPPTIHERWVTDEDLLTGGVPDLQDDQGDEREAGDVVPAGRSWDRALEALAVELANHAITGLNLMATQPVEGRATHASNLLLTLGYDLEFVNEYLTRPRMLDELRSFSVLELALWRHREGGDE